MFGMKSTLHSEWATASKTLFILIPWLLLETYGLFSMQGEKAWYQNYFSDICLVLNIHDQRTAWK